MDATEVVLLLLLLALVATVHVMQPRDRDAPASGEPERPGSGDTSPADQPAVAPPVSRLCPRCGAAGYTRVPAARLMAFANDRVCRSCGARYSPPTPRWAAVVFLLAGTVLTVAAAGGFAAAAVTLADGKLVALGWLPLYCAVGLPGLLALRHGVRAFVRPGRV